MISLSIAQFPHSGRVQLSQHILFMCSNERGILRLWTPTQFCTLCASILFIVSNLSDPRRRNLMVYVNPFSGRGKAMQIYKNHVKPMFAEAHVEHQVVKTGS